MKLPRSFDQFLREHVNLNQTRVDQANGAFDTLTAFLKNHEEMGKHFRGTSKQGSLRQGTIIKPRKGRTEFDVDLLLIMQVVERWSPTDYLDAVHAAFEASDRYKSLVDRRGKHRCVTIDYAGDFHVDVVPSVQSDAGQWIMNRKTDEYELTDGDGYAKWFATRNTISGGQLVPIVRLVKYLRDEHEWPVKSILLTTLLGRHVANTDGAAQYGDVPTALRRLVSRLDAWLRVQPTVPAVVNPVLPQEEFTRHWDDATFKKFKDGFRETAAAIVAAYDEPNLQTSLEHWREAFGEDFPLDDRDVEGDAVALTAQPSLGSTTHARPVSDIAIAEKLTSTVRLDGWVYDVGGKTRFRGINSNANVASGRAIRFKAWTNVPEPYEVRWQVVNTGQHAQQENGLRGEFFSGRDLAQKPTPKLLNWETTRYTGRHWIECFILKDGVCVGRSGPFYLNIKNPSFNAASV